MKLQPELKAATIGFIPMPGKYEIPVICFEYAQTRVKPNEPFFYGSIIKVGKAREKRMTLLNQKAA